METRVLTYHGEGTIGRTAGAAAERPTVSHVSNRLRMGMVKFLAFSPALCYREYAEAEAETKQAADTTACDEQ